MAQFQYLIEFFVHISHVLGIDLPGCGQSAMKPTDWDAYTPEALVELLETVIAQFLEEGQQFVIVAHSMGCSLATKLITAANEGALAGRCAGFVAICPKAELSTKEAKALASIVNIPGFIFDLWRRYDRRGGLNSDSVVRFVGATSSLKVKALQYRFNSQSRTPTWRRMVKKAKFATKDEWAKVKCPIYLLAGSEDKVCPVTEMDKIYNWLAESTVSQEQGQVRAVEKVVIPNAGHGVLYELPHITSKYIGEFLKTHVSEVLDLGWQLSYLKEDKWMLKNLNKWNKVQPVSELVGPSKFRAMKVSGLSLVDMTIEHSLTVVGRPCDRMTRITTQCLLQRSILTSAISSIYRMSNLRTIRNLWAVKLLIINVRKPRYGVSVKTGTLTLLQFRPSAKFLLPCTRFTILLS